MVGTEIYMPCEAMHFPRVPPEIKEILANVDQHISIETAFGASIKDILEGQDPLLK